MCHYVYIYIIFIIEAIIETNITYTTNKKREKTKELFSSQKIYIFFKIFVISKILPHMYKVLNIGKKYLIA